VGLLGSDILNDGCKILYGIISDGIHTHPAALHIAHCTHPDGQWFTLLYCSLHCVCVCVCMHMHVYVRMHVCARSCVCMRGWPLNIRDGLKLVRLNYQIIAD
jgi:hypothetical protein